MQNLKTVDIIRPDDWHVHLREGKLLKCILKSTTRINQRCVAMPNLSLPITSSSLCKKYYDF